MLNPLGIMLVLSPAFSQILRLDIPNYAAFMLCGLISWNFFSQTTHAAIVNLVWGVGLHERIYIARSSFALAATRTGLVNLVFSMGGYLPGMNFGLH